MTFVTIPVPKSLPSTPMQGTPRAMPLLPLRTPPQQASGAGGPIRSDAEAEANRSRINYMSPSLLSDEMIGSRHAYGPGLFDIPTAALLTGSFVAPASPSFSPFKYWQPQPLETQQQSQSAQAKKGDMHFSSYCVGIK